MGSEGPEADLADGEGPVRQVTLAPFLIEATTVTNAAFSTFVEATGHVTDAEREGWSFVFAGLLPKAKARKKRRQGRDVAGLEWWLGLEGACWKKPLGPGSDLRRLEDHPVVHVSWNDAAAYAAWADRRLPTEAEWEYASRGGHEGRIFPWGNDLEPGGEHHCNVWQGAFPNQNTLADGHFGTAPVRTFPPNDFGLFQTIGNVWEWCVDYWDPHYHRMDSRLNPEGPPTGNRRIAKGGSYLCHNSYCNRYRCSARTSNTPDSSAGNWGFRCARDPS